MNRCLAIKSVAETVGGNPVNILTVSTGKSYVDDKDTKIVWILARQHPSETTSSFMIEGIIDYLTEVMNKSRQAS